MALVTALAACALTAPPSPALRPSIQEYSRLAQDMDHHLRTEILPAWFPRTIDSQYGGFHSNYRNDWSPFGANQKGLVYESRMTWLAATVAAEYPDLAAQYRDYARHGASFLRQRLWDQQDGGFYFMVDQDGRPVAPYGEQKHAYGQAFAIYGLAKAARVTGDVEIRKAAIAAFQWLDAKAHDAQYGGYLEAMRRDGQPILTAGPTTAPVDRIDALEIPYGRKTMNVHIHLLEALTELYRIYPDAILRQRLAEMHHIVRDVIVVDPGYLNLQFTRDWKPLPGLQSYGHDMETAFLLLESADALGQAQDPQNLAVARRLVDHALPFGFDESIGGMFDEGKSGQPASSRAKWWWVQAECLNALLLMHEHFGGETDRYWNAFVKQWQFIDEHVIDHQNGEWFMKLSPEGKSLLDAKANEWKAGYHDGRALFEVRKRLLRLGGVAPAAKDAAGDRSPSQP